ncbi:MAG TPA: class I SAM-dependent methyltransferase [Gracilimonas sp.]|uniref:class I SAM-dependent methyltransferase n=1 Tax=Gracilimonas sp. TaxID=1974203 RepID=UPI002DA6D32B|nr:class I SAM-dependent methyltransferase [Gracilimonas sp.]
MDKEKKDISQTAASYNNQAERYEERWKAYLSHTHQKLLNIFECEKGHRILDVSAGTGLFAKHLNESGAMFSEIVLNDVSGKMLNIARKRFEDQAAISFTEDSSERLSFQDNSFDSVISLNAFHNYKDQEGTLSEIHRVLKPGGRFYLLDWNRKGFFRLINFCIDVFSGEFIQTRNADELNKALESLSFQVNTKEEWGFRYWKFYLMVAVK